MKTLINKLKNVLSEYDEIKYSVKQDTILELIKADKLRQSTNDKWYSSLIVEYSKSLSKQTNYNIKPSVFRSLLSACLETDNHNIETYTQLLRILKVEVK